MQSNNTAAAQRVSWRSRKSLTHQPYAGGDENSHIGVFDFYPIFIPLFERKVSGVSVQDMLLRLPFLTPETRHLKPKSRNKNGLKS